MQRELTSRTTRPTSSSVPKEEDPASPTTLSTSPTNTPSNTPAPLLLYLPLSRLSGLTALESNWRPARCVRKGPRCVDQELRRPHRQCTRKECLLSDLCALQIEPQGRALDREYHPQEGISS